MSLLKYLNDNLSGLGLDKIIKIEIESPEELKQKFFNFFKNKFFNKTNNTSIQLDNDILKHINIKINDNIKKYIFIAVLFIFFILKNKKED